MAEQIKLDIDLAAIKKEVSELRAELAVLRKEGDAAFDGLSSDVKGLVKEFQDLSAVESKVNAEMKKTDQAAGGFFARLKSGIADTQVFGKSLGEWGNQLSGIVGKLSGGGDGVGRFSGALRGLSVAIKATGIGLLITLVGSAISYFTRWQAGIDKVSQITAGFSAVVNVLVERLVSFGSAIVKVITLDFTGAAKDMSQAVTGLGSAIVDAAVGAYELERRFQDLRDAAITSAVETSRQQAVLERYKSIVDDGTQSLGRRSAAAQKAGQIEAEIATRQFDQALESLDLERQRFALSTKTTEDRQRLANAETAFQEATIQREKTIYDNARQQREFRKEASAERLRQLSEESKALEKLKKDLENLRVEGQQEGLDKDLAAINKKYDQLTATAKAGVQKLNEIEKRRALSQEELAQREEFGGLAVQIEERRLDALLNTLSEFNEKELAADQEQADKKKELSDKEQKTLIDSINAQKAIQDEQLAQGEAAVEAYLLRLEQQGASEKEIKDAQAEFDLLTQQARLKTEIEFQEKLLAATGDGDKARADQIAESIKTLRAELENINFQIDNPVEGKKPFSIFALLGLDPNDPDFDKQKKAIEKSFGDLVKGLEKVTDARVEAAEAAVESADRQVDAAEDALDREIELAQLGFASNVDLKKQELEEAKIAREKALEEQKRAQRQQLALDAVAQASNIAVSSTNLIKSWSTLPFGIGLLLAFAQVAQIVAFMGNIRAKAKAISSQQFRTGGEVELSGDGFIKGPSHEGGGVVPEVEGGEFLYSDGRRMAVVKKSATQQHFGLLRAINEDNRPAMREYLERLTGGVRRDTEATVSAAGTVTQYRDGGGSDAALMADNNRLFVENNKLTRRLVQLEEERSDAGEYVDMGDHVLHIRKGRTNKIKKRG